MKYLSIIGFCLSVCCIFPASGEPLRWKLCPEAIEWSVMRGDAPHTDHLEMAGRRLASIVTYGTDTEGKLVLSRRLIFPMLRTIPNDTHASLNDVFEQNNLPTVKIDGMVPAEYPQRFRFDGTLRIESRMNDGEAVIRRDLYPSTLKAAWFERSTLTNTGNRILVIDISAGPVRHTTVPEKGVYGSYITEVRADKSGQFEIAPGDSLTWTLVYSGRTVDEQPYDYAPAYEYAKRRRFLNETMQNLVLVTPNDTVNRFFAYAKVRATESIFDTKRGLMHAPGGQPYYAAIWANDQAEYANPFFPFLGNLEGNESALNSFRLFASYMNDAYRPIPSSIIAEGDSYWNSAGDRGDQAMIAYGAARFALAYGRKAEAEELWPLIEWCLEYLRRKTNAKGIIESDTDELERRFPAGSANLSTNSLAYGAWISASHLARELGQTETSLQLQKEAAVLARRIEAYFGATVEGFDTYRYYAGNTTLRAWIGLPLTMGLFDRREQTLQAMFSDKLWSKNGILTESGSETYWDRSTLYAFNGMFYAGATNEAWPYWSFYTAQRLLGEHVPYAIEAWPEGNQRHLSAESALYCRAIIEGLFGLRPVGLHAFSLKPVLPDGWKEARLENIRAFDRCFSLTVRPCKRQGINVIVNQGDTVKKYRFNGKEPVIIEL